MPPAFRKRLDHHAHFAGRFGAVYFVTICCQPRGLNQLCREEPARIVFDTAKIYHEKMRWHLLLMLLMPDHLHALVSIDARDSLAETFRSYKRITAKLAQITWQRNFFDHRIRHAESLQEKAAYIRQNPIRGGLTNCEDNWPYILTPESCGGDGPQSLPRNPATPLC
jgi:putative transposase